MGGQSNAFCAVFVTRDEQRFIFPPRGIFFLTSVCVRGRVSWSLPCLPFERETSPTSAAATHAQLLLTRRRRRRAKGTARQLSMDQIERDTVCRTQIQSK